MATQIVTTDGNVVDPNEWEAPASEAMTVDLEINTLVLDAATARLPLVQAQERQRLGKAVTNLSTLAEEILRTWQPGATKRPQPSREVRCPHCRRMVRTYNTGKLRVHGKPGARCPETFADGGPRVTETRPLRFPMNRAEYTDVKERIHIHGQSVASVITQRLAHFAKEGRL